MSESQMKMEDGEQSKIIQMQQRLQEVQTQKEQMANELLQVRQEHLLKDKLIAAGVIDTETAMLVVRARLSQDDKADADKVLGQLRKDKPYLFEALSATAFSATRGAKEKPNVNQERLKTAAARAIQTAGRTELMEYMKARRAR